MRQMPGFAPELILNSKPLEKHYFETLQIIFFSFV